MSSSPTAPWTGGTGGAAEAASIDLADRAVMGDPDALRAVWESNRRWIAAVILAHKPKTDDLEDLLQDVAMTFVSKISTLREPANIRAWLRAIAVNAARASGRRGRYRPAPMADGLDARPAPAPRHGDATHREEAQCLMHRVESLPATYREPLLLRAMQGLRSKQIAELLGVPPATVDTRIARARRMLAEMAEGTTEIAGTRMNGELR